MRYLVLLGLLSACNSAHLPFIYKKDVVQGNVYTAEMLAQIQQGMSREQVHQILGTPQLSDPFRPDEEVYFYRYFSGDSKQVYQKQLNLRYVNNQLSSIQQQPSQIKE